MRRTSVGLLKISGKNIIAITNRKQKVIHDIDFGGDLELAMAA